MSGHGMRQLSSEIDLKDVTGGKGGGIYSDSREHSLQSWLEAIGKLILA